MGTGNGTYRVDKCTHDKKKTHRETKRHNGHWEWYIWKKNYTKGGEVGREQYISTTSILLNSLTIWSEKWQLFSIVKNVNAY